MMDSDNQRKILAQFPRSKVWDRRTQQAIDTIRLYMHRRPQPTITYIQQNSRQGKPVKNGFRTEQDVVLPPVEDDIRKLLFRVIKEMGSIRYEEPKLAPVPVEWTSIDSSKSDISKLVVFHVHGGAFL
jgi:hypothetical protein